MPATRFRVPRFVSDNILFEFVYGSYPVQRLEAKICTLAQINIKADAELKP
jgi:hypothetical protein